MADGADLTLRDGLAKYAARNASILTTRDLSDGATAFFRGHDTAHVVFDCDTSLLGEGTVKLWTIFGTTLGFWRHLRGYSDAGAFGLFRQYGARHVITNSAALVRTMPDTVRRARAVRRRWPWLDHDAYLDWTLGDIRAEFGIRLPGRVDG